MISSLVLNPTAFLKVSKANKKIMNFLGIFFAACLLGISILQINGYTREVFEIRSYEAKISSLTKENKLLEIKLSESNTFNNIGSHLSDFVKAGKIDYIQVMNSKVASQIK